MDGLQLRDEAVRDRIRAAEEFLDPSECSIVVDSVQVTDLSQMTPVHEGEQNNYRPALNKG